MEIRHSKTVDTDGLMQLFEEARKTIAALGIDQWQNGYPSREVIEEDIRNGISYLAEEDGEICATFVLLSDGEPTYDKIYEGRWNTDGDYIALHRVAIAVKHRGRGLAEKILHYSADFAKNKGINDLRIDTHRGNVVMRRMLEKNGFSYRGIIHLKNGDERVAYEKEL